MGSITALVDSDGNIAQTYSYDSFGNIINSSGTISQPYTFTSREYDEETGLYYYRARYYDAKIGRFLQEDPFSGYIRIPSTQNHYTYVINNPLNLIDPWGLKPNLTFNFGGHAPIAPGVAVGTNFTISNNPNYDSAKNEIEFGAIFDFGVSAGADWSCGRDPGGTIAFGLGKYAGLQLTIDNTYTGWKLWRYIDAVSVGVGFGLTSPVTYTVDMPVPGKKR
ncbi:MAG: RHS repeat-associated core domain-containing protein [bacterium]|nr:RHS repeat-associated core domain-containing protein [bacterium]